MKIITKDGENITGIETNNNIYYLRESKPINDAKRYSDIIKEFERFFDVSRVDTHVDEEENEWFTVDELKKFHAEKYQKTQVYFDILAMSGDWLSTRQLLRKFEELGHGKLVPQSLAGIRAGNTKSYRSWKKEPLDESRWNDKEEQNYYRIKPKYLDRLRQALKK